MREDLALQAAAALVESHQTVARVPMARRLPTKMVHKALMVPRLALADSEAKAHQVELAK